MTRLREEKIKLSQELKKNQQLIEEENQQKVLLNEKLQTLQDQG